MIDPDFLANLPDDPEQAFVEVSNAQYVLLQEAYEYAQQTQTSAVHAERDYMAIMRAAITNYEIEDLDGWGQTFSENFVNAVRETTARLTFKHAAPRRKYTVAFDAATKIKLHHYLEQIRKVVHDSADSEDKKDALYGCINLLGAEIDCSRSGYEKFTAMVGGLATLTAETWEKLSPMVKGVMGTVENTKAKENARLPAPPVKKQIEHKNGFDKQLDDEIPF